MRHRGRKTGSIYSTPVNLYRSPIGYVIALPYGSGRDWVKNVLHFGGCEVESRGQTLTVTEPRVVYDPSLHLIPAPVRPLLKALGVTEVLELRARGG